jgi:hypothetical protein
MLDIGKFVECFRIKINGMELSAVKILGENLLQ